MAEVARLDWHGDEVQRLTEADVQRRLLKACIMVTNTAKENLAVGGASGFKTSHGDLGSLRGSIAYEVEGFVGRVGSNLKYARIQELGGVITPKTAKALAIPIHPEAQRASGPRSFTNLKLIPRPGKPSLLIRQEGRKTYSRTSGKKRVAHIAVTRWDLMYVLVKSVTLPARPYLRPALWSNEGAIRELFARPMK